ncbi:hypothetical protein AB0F72_40450 [Actinoplanes sp. NPDC023936]|uniref:hypothetical protein n=1 Tax=Actinoplanes sp. NPDC023936 TaxID=3154910 RepID=UPI0033CF2114
MTRYKFESVTAHYANVASPAEKLLFEWDPDTGMPSRLEWLHGGVPWYLHNEPGQITKENPNLRYFDVDLRVTTAKHEEVERALKGKLTCNVNGPPHAAVFAAILEGTGSSWLVAEGTLVSVD